MWPLSSCLERASNHAWTRKPPTLGVPRSIVPRRPICRRDVMARFAVLLLREYYSSGTGDAVFCFDRAVRGLRVCTVLGFSEIRRIPSKVVAASGGGRFWCAIVWRRLSAFCVSSSV